LLRGDLSYGYFTLSQDLSWMTNAKYSLDSENLAIQIMLCYSLFILDLSQSGSKNERKRG